MSKKKTQSIRGEVIDFDLLKVKQTMEDRDKPDSVEMREKYIDVRRRRNPRRNVSDLVDEQRQNQEDARRKIQQSKETKETKETKESSEQETSVKNEVTVDDIVEGGYNESEPETTPETTSTPNRTSKKRIVKRKTTDDNS